jgi:hypothetical protein
MIDTSMLLHLLLAFAVGSLWVTAITVIAEKKGSVIGGILGGLPSTFSVLVFLHRYKPVFSRRRPSNHRFPLSLRRNQRIHVLLGFFRAEKLQPRHHPVTCHLVRGFCPDCCIGV